MKPKQQRIAIAKACGYYLDTEKSDESLWWLCKNEQPNGIGDCKPNKQMCWGYAPDYLNDLNAMHEAEKTLDYNQMNRYQNIELSRFVHTGTTWICSATAAQRAEAFLRTLNQWKQ